MNATTIFCWFFGHLRQINGEDFGPNPAEQILVIQPRQEAADPLYELHYEPDDIASRGSGRQRCDPSQHVVNALHDTPFIQPGSRPRTDLWATPRPSQSDRHTDTSLLSPILGLRPVHEHLSISSVDELAPHSAELFISLTP